MKTIFLLVGMAILLNITYGGRRHRRRHCPKPMLPNNTPCFWRNNQCCSKKDCEKWELCCVEGCGNTCRTPIRKSGRGTRVNEDDTTCQIGIPGPGGYCPKPSGAQCYVYSNQCCNNEDCKKGELCCVEEGCGNTCKTPVETPEGGTMFTDDNTCQLGIPTRGPYCPEKLHISCAVTGNRCCDDGDCEKPWEVCCKEACGSQCRNSFQNETNGEKYCETPEVCQKDVFTNF